MDPVIPIPIPDDKLEELVEKAKDFALMHGKREKKLKSEINDFLEFLGICMRQKNNFDRDALHFAPFVLLLHLSPVMSMKSLFHCSRFSMN